MRRLRASRFEPPLSEGDFLAAVSSRKGKKTRKENTVENKSAACGVKSGAYGARRGRDFN